MRIPVNSLVRITVATLLLVVGLVASDAHYSTAQTVTIDYDLDNDGLIEVSNANQWRAIHYDLNGDGTPESRSAPWHGTNTPWATGFPNAMTAAGCPPRDHDNDPATADQASCIGYELISDIDLADGGSIVLGSYGESGRDQYTAKFVGNGFRVSGLRRYETISDFTQFSGAFSEVAYSATIEGLGVIAPDFHEETASPEGGITSRLEGKLIGSYVEGGWVRSGLSGGLVGRVATHATNGYGIFAHSYARGTRVGSTALRHGGLVGQMEHQRGTGGVNKSTCLNSYFSGDVDQSTRGLIVGENQNGQGRYINCVGDSTTDANDGGHSTTTTGAGAGTIAATNAVMTAASGYTGPFAGWDDYPLDGTITPLDATEPRVDVWYFGDETNLPVLKGWGHDMTLPLGRGLSGNDTVNLCTRTLQVANEIIRLLKDDTFATGVTGPVPADVMSLTDCTSQSSTRNVSIDNLRDYAVTTESNPFNLSSDRVDPPLRKMASLDANDFAYLSNVSHIDLSSNSFTTLPTRLFQGLALRWLDLSDNKLTSLPADLFAGLLATSTSGSLANPPAPPATFAGGKVYLNANELTDTGIPGRVFDSLTEMNGLDLSNNSLTRINTRWFEQLANLGRKAAPTTELEPGLGLRLAGNAVTEHYYSTKLFTGVRSNVVRYRGDDAGDDLRTAIKAAITTAAGGTTPTTLDLDTTDYYVREGANAGYQPSGTTCPTSATVGSPRLTYLSSATPDCYIIPHWTAPYIPGATAAPDPQVGVEQEQDVLSVTLAHTASDGFVGYQIRYRAIPADPNSEYCVTYQQVLQVCYDELPADPVEGWAQDWIYVAISQSSGTKTIEVSGVDPDSRYQVQVRAVSRIGPMSETVVAAEAPMNVELEQDLRTGTLTLSWDSPDHYIPAGYEYRTRAVGSEQWSRWTRVDHQGARASRQQTIVVDLRSGVEYEFQVRVLGVGTTDQTTVLTETPRSTLPKVDSIKPTIREVSVRAGDRIALTVDVYNAQQRLDNELPATLNGQLVFRWSEQGSGGGTFADPANTRRVTYTAPNLPGRYTVTAEAQPDGVCLSHHEGAAEITTADRAPCIATFTISVSRAPADATPRPDPVNPAGIIPTSMTDNAGTAYTVFTPVDGGTFTSDNLTVTAPAGAVPDRTLLGVTAAVSALPPPIPIPGASMSVAGNHYDINGIQQSGQAPLTAYSLNDPITVCLPFPQEFRADLSNTVAVQRAADGGLSILTTKVRANAGNLTVCGAVSTLPATVAVAKLGTVPTVAPTPAPEEALPEAGATAPNGIMVVLMLLAGLALLTGIYRMRRMIRG